MGNGGTRAGSAGWLDRAATAALLLAAAAAIAAAVRMGEAAGRCSGDLLAELQARTGRRVAAERGQIRPILEAAASGDREGARRDAEAALARLAGNSQLHLFLAGAYRERGEAGPALREYRRAVELVRDYADRRSPHAIGAGLSPWLRAVRPAVADEALRDLHYLERSLAGGCS